MTVRRALLKVLAKPDESPRKPSTCRGGSEGLHKLLTVCILWNLCKATAAYVHVGLGISAADQVHLFSASEGYRLS